MITRSSIPGDLDKILVIKCLQKQHTSNAENGRNLRRQKLIEEMSRILRFIPDAVLCSTLVMVEGSEAGSRHKQTVGYGQQVHGTKLSCYGET